MPSASSLVIRALKEPPRDRKKEKNIKHNKSVSLDEIIEIARTMRFKSFSKSLEGVVKEVLGTAFSVGCQVDGKSPKAISDAIGAGEIDSEWDPHPRLQVQGFIPGMMMLTICVQFLRSKCRLHEAKVVWDSQGLSQKEFRACSLKLRRDHSKNEWHCYDTPTKL